MTIRHTAMKRRRTAAVALAAVAALAIAGCSDDSGKKNDGSSKQSASSQQKDTGRSGETNSPEPEPSQTLAEIKGDQDIVITITKAERDSGGFVTVEGTITNNGDTAFTGASYWKGSEQELNASGNSVAGATLVDPVGKKRYYVLRDTEGRCLYTMKLVNIEPKAKVPFFAQFPAPPDSTTEVQFQLPTMPPAQIEISG